MKFALVLFFFLISFKSIASVDNTNCPEEIKINYSNLKNIDLTDEINGNETLFAAFQSIQNIPTGEHKFHLSKVRIPGYCSYLTGNNGWDSLFIDFYTIEGFDKLTIGIDYESSAKFIVNVQSYSRSHIEISNDLSSKIVYGQHLTWIDMPTGELGAIVRDVKIGDAAELTVEVVK